MVSERRSGNKIEESAMSQEHDVGASTQRDPRRYPEKEESTKNMDHDYSMLASRLEEEVARLASYASFDVWYIDSGSSRHMTGIRECFLNYQEERMNFRITMGNKAKCTPIGRGTVVFQTEAGDRLRATNVLHVLRLGMNLLSVSQLQNKGYDVFFIKEKVYVKHPSWKKKAHIGFRSNKLYRLQLEFPMALIGSSGEKDLNELWHRRMGHLHHGALTSRENSIRSSIIKYRMRWCMQRMLTRKVC